ncbi:hypothetical protein [Nocardioides aurantiacus]|uniref:Uncharacterized protein n=1 Tax=Nocardioides aurantiacus TaxID=86796 RepID=A0A3N2CSN4_9ACTN|nr:hypothetical protein [Nocardioides aurantiacus]ROR90553.1 hypothetical protein EDD33_1394 [Nocardioides aurantiacus]
MRYSLDPAENYADTVPAGRLRPATLDHELRGILAFSQRTFTDDETRDAALHDELQISPVLHQHDLRRAAKPGS